MADAFLDHVAQTQAAFGAGATPTPATNQSNDLFLDHVQRTLQEAGVAPRSLVQDMGSGTATVATNNGIPQGFDLDTFIAQQQADESAYIQRNAIPGVPLDVRSGAGIITRLRTGAQRSKLAQLQVLRNIYGDDAVRLDDEGNFIARLQGDNGQPREVLVDEREMTAADLLDLSSEMPAFIASLATTKGIPVQQVFKNALRGAVSYSLGGLATDAASAAAESNISPEWGEIFTTRGGNAITDTIFGYGFGKGINAIGTLPRLARLTSSHLSDTPQQAAMVEVEAGRKAMSQRFGIEQQPSVAELTGNPAALRLETFLSNIPFARKWILNKWQNEIDKEKAIQSAFLGGKAPDPAATGSELIDLLGGEMQRAEAMRNKAGSIVQRQAGEAITDPLETLPQRPLSAHQFGTRMIRRGEAQLASFKARANELYDRFRNLPEATGAFFDATPIQVKALALKDELVKDAGGDVAKSLAPSGILSVLNDVDKLPANQSYFDLVKLRDAIYDRLDAPSEPISDRGSRLLKQLGRSITEEMETQGKPIFGANWSLVEDATKYYRDNVESFYQKGVSGMLKPRTEAGAIDPERLAANVLAGGKGSVTTYRTLRDFFTKQGAVTDMNRLFRDRLIEQGTDNATGLLKLDSLAGAVSKLEPEIAQELFGKSKDAVLRDFQHGQVVERTGALPRKVSGDENTVVADEFKRLLDAGELNGPAMRRLLSTSMDLRIQQRNAIRRAVKENDFGVVEANPATFVKDYFLNPAISEREVADAMRSIYRTGNTQLVEDIRRIALSDVFDKAARTTKGDVAQLVSSAKGSPLRTLDPQKLAFTLQQPETRKRLTEILGPDTFTDLQNFALSMGGRAVRDQVGEGVARFVGGGIFHKILSGLDGLREMPQYIALSWLMTSPKTVQFLRQADKLGGGVNLDRAIKSAVLTPEFMRVIGADSANPEEAHQVAAEIKRWAEQGQR